MSSIEKISIALPAEMVRSLRQAVDTGEYASSSEVVRDALRDWTHKRKLRRQGLRDLRALWRQALTDKIARPRSEASHGSAGEKIPGHRGDVSR